MTPVRNVCFVEFISFFTSKNLLAAIELGMAEIWGAGAAPLTLLTPIVSRLDLMYIYVFLDLVPGMKRFARSVVWKTLHKSLPIKDALSCLAPRGFDAMPNPRWMKTTGRIKSVLSPLAHPGFDVTPTTVVHGWVETSCEGLKEIVSNIKRDE